MRKGVEMYGSQVERALEQLHSTFPEEIELTFTYTPVSNGPDLHHSSIGNVSVERLNDYLLTLLEEVKSKDTLQKEELRCLQVLIQLTNEQQKRAPLILHT